MKRGGLLNSGDATTSKIRGIIYLKKKSKYIGGLLLKNKFFFLWVLKDTSKSPATIDAMQEILALGSRNI